MPILSKADKHINPTFIEDVKSNEKARDKLQSRVTKGNMLLFGKIECHVTFDSNDTKLKNNMRRLSVQVRLNNEEVDDLHNLLIIQVKLNDEEAECTGKTECCKKVKRAIYRFALNELNLACKASNKSNMLPLYSNLKCQEYITSLHPKPSRLLFKAKLGMFDIKCNFKNKYRNNLLCPICSVTDEKLQHLTVCSSNSYINVYKIKSSYDIYDNDFA